MATAIETPKATARLRWRFSPAHLIALLLLCDGLLFAADRFGWFGFDEHKGFAVLINVALAAFVAVLLAIWLALASIFRTRFRISIRTLVVATIAVSLPMSWLASTVRDARRQRKAAFNIATMGGQFGSFSGPKMPLWLAPTEPAWLLRLFGPEFFGGISPINLRGRAGTDAALAELDGVYDVEALMLSCPSASDAGLQHIGKLSRLQYLSIVANHRFTANGFAALANLHELRYLDLTATSTSDAALQSLRSMQKLRVLRLTNDKITDAGMDAIGELTGLQELFLSHTKITSKGLKEIERLQQLRRLEVSETHVRSLDGIEQMTNLFALVLDDTAIDDSALEHISHMSQLGGLSLRETSVTDAGLKHLQKMSHLEAIDLTGAGEVSDDAVAELRKSLRNCAISH